MVTNSHKIWRRKQDNFKTIQVTLFQDKYKMDFYDMLHLNCLICLKEDLLNLEKLPSFQCIFPN